jgi:hypothetical protein
MAQRPAAVQTGSVASRPSRRKRRRCYFSPSDDQRLRACRSREELLDVIAAIVQESNYSRRSVVNHAKDLGVWCKFQEPKAECELSILRLLGSSATQEDPLDVIAAKLRITRAAARRRIYRDDECVESLVGGTYSAREVAEGFCIRRSTLSALIQSGPPACEATPAHGKAAHLVRRDRRFRSCVSTPDPVVAVFREIVLASRHTRECSISKSSGPPVCVTEDRS